MNNNYKHGMSRSPTYNSWRGMLARCRARNIMRYGARGIIVCDRWKTFTNFLVDMGLRPIGTSIDRIDGDEGYSKSNCQWATRSEQASNRTWSATGQKYISKRGNGFEFQLTKNGKTVSKYFKKLKRAIEFRNKFLANNQ